MNDRKVLYGVCGIGMGHTLRQQPIIDHLAKYCRVVIFAYGQSYRHFSERFRDAHNVSVMQVSVPYYYGGSHGIDFARSGAMRPNSAENALLINCTAMAEAQRVLGRPDLVITDYEPVSAQYAYSQGAPLVTIDQQSKYLVGSFPAELRGEGYLDEVQRLRMFFPKADARFACSFFRVERRSRVPEKVQVIPPTLNASILSMGRRRRTARGGKEILMYISTSRDFSLSTGELTAVLASQPDWRFHVFLPSGMLEAGLGSNPAGWTSSTLNVSLYATGDARYQGILERCGGIISTAGHSLLSEAMHLRKPVYALPLSVYEQQMNAHVIDSNGFGIARPHLTEPQLAEFLGALPDFAANIARDKRTLLRGSSQTRIIRYLERNFLS